MPAIIKLARLKRTWLDSDPILRSMDASMATQGHHDQASRPRFPQHLISRPRLPPSSLSQRPNPECCSKLKYCDSAAPPHVEALCSALNLISKYP